METADTTDVPLNLSTGSSTRASLRNGPPRWLAIALSVVAGFGPPATVVIGGLDASWQLGLSWARVLGLEWGRDIVFTYGPWGAVAAPVPLSSALMWQALLVAALTLSLVASSTRSIIGVERGWWAVLLTLLVTSAAASCGLATALFLAVVLGSADRILRSLDEPRALSLLGAVAGFSLLVKFNTGIASIAIGALCAFAFTRRSMAIASFAAGVGVGVAGGWVAARQPLGALVPWLQGSGEMAAAYTSAMRHVRADLAGWLPLAVLALGLGMAFVIGAFVWFRGTALDARRRTILTLAELGAVAALYLASATRFDAGHLGLFPCALFVLGVPFAGGLGARGPARSRTVSCAATVAFALVCVALSVAILGGDGLTQYLHPVKSVAALRDDVKYAASASARESALEAQRAAIRDFYPVPAWELKTLDPKASRLAAPARPVVDALRGRRVHVEPWAGSLAWAHGLEWKPVPVIQTYAAYTRHLDELNAVALRSDDGPTGILRQSAAIDGKNPLWESPHYQLAMACTFAEVATDGQWHALARVPYRCGSARTLGKTTIDAQQMIPVPEVAESLVIAELSLPGGASGRTKKPAVVSCGGASYRLAQGLPSGPLLMRATSTGWDRAAIPASCGSVGANRRVEIVFTAVPVLADTDSE